MANTAIKPLLWAKDELQSYIDEIIGGHKKSHVSDMLLINLTGTEINFVKSYMDNRIDFSPSKSIEWSISNQHVLFYQIPGFNENKSGLSHYGSNNSDFKQRVRDFFSSMEEGAERPRFPIGDLVTYDPHFQVIKGVCRNNEYALMFPWVTEEMVRLRRLNTKESLSKFDELINAYKATGKGDKKWDRYRKDINQWWLSIYPNAKKLISEGNKRTYVYERIRIDHKLKGAVGENIRACEEIEKLRNALIYLVRFQLVTLPSLGIEIHWASNLNQLFHASLIRIVPNMYDICWELFLYKQIRGQFSTREYSEGLFSLRLSDLWGKDGMKGCPPNPIPGKEISSEHYKFTGRSLEDLFQETASKARTDVEELKSIYGMLREIEAEINHEYDYWDDIKNEKGFNDLKLERGYTEKELITAFILNQELGVGS